MRERRSASTGHRFLGSLALGLLGFAAAGCYESSTLLGDERDAGLTDRGPDADADDVPESDTPADRATDGPADDIRRDGFADGDGTGDLGDVATPDVGDDVPIGELVGPPVPLDDGTNAGGEISAAWNGSGWGVIWADMLTPMTFRALSPDATPLGPAVPVLDRWRAWHVSLAWHAGRYGLAFSTNYFEHGDEGTLVAVLDEAGAVAAGPTALGDHSSQPDLAWSDEAHGWLVAFRTDGDDETSRIRAARFDESVALLDEILEVGEGGRDLGPRVVPLKSRTALVWPDERGVWFRGFSWPDVAAAPPPTRLMELTLMSDSFIEADALLDDAVVVGMGDGAVTAVAVEPWSGTVTGGPTTAGLSEIRDRRPGLVGAPARGYLGLCYETGPGPWGGGAADGDGVSFRLLAPDARPIGAELIVAAGLRNIGGCAVGWSGEEFVVLYWSCGGDGEWNTVYAQRIRPLV